jgi:integrase
MAGNVHPRIVSELLGHSEIRTTLDLYSHVSATMQREAADQLEAV